MSNPSIADRIKIIKDIELAQPQTQAGAARGVVYADGEDSAAVNAGASVSFVGNITGQMKFDVLNSTLFAQLAANKQYNRQDETTQWYDYYKYVLETVGWNVQNFDFAYQSDANTYLTVDKLLLKLAASYLSGGELALFTAMVDALKDAKNESAVTLFDNSSKAFKKANFQVGVASNAQGNAMFKIGVYYYGAEQNINRVLFFTFGNQKVEFYAGNQTMLLNEDVYSQVRQSVLDKLGDNAKDLVDNIEL
ncbi:hypothetical protein L226DRAFT_541164 [Lentinus tigrinus ALCF2SS1-7]|uniref:Uncharacterized protein n=1 Tax=Lentinus tigrinus ALCF2SS1-6 TaxID=1328759 RepID=A0A5C2RRW6_9APHY|nr:hypothetical protein L227DRAFT_580526 [Lentinus tigrinus ALCF2SS1-6]RPD67834.1 hypothetical protein L226DRAFT_541164 [Lentinus tigrinus ALCF2SS1-7]